MISQNHLKLIFCLLAASSNISYAAHFAWTPELKQAYLEATSLQLVAAQKSLAIAERKDPDNLMVLHVANYIDFFHVYIDEDEAAFDRLEKNRNIRLKKIEKEGDASSPWYKFLQADIRLQWALSRLKFEEFTTAFFEANKAFKLLTANVEEHPDFMPNYKDLGILHAMSGTIPDNYRWAVNWFSSVEGTLEQGRGELQKALDYAHANDFIYEDEIYIYYAYLQLHLENDSEAAWGLINEARLDPQKNPLHCFVVANIAMRTGRGNKAIQVLQKTPKGNQYHPFYYLDYLLGLAKLESLDLTAEEDFLRFVCNFRGKNFIKDAYQKLAWCRLLKGDLNGYHVYMGKCVSEGETIVGNDKSALKEAEEGFMPASELLRARLLFDGGYFNQAYAMLKAKNAEEYLSDRNRLEYNYRLARIEQALNKNVDALRLYDIVIDAGSDKPWYYACRAALEKGHIFEQQRQREQARKAFEKCLQIDPEDHATGLHQQAKAGLKRIE